MSGLSSKCRGWGAQSVSSFRAHAHPGRSRRWKHSANSCAPCPPTNASRACRKTYNETKHEQACTTRAAPAVLARTYTPTTSVNGVSLAKPDLGHSACAASFGPTISTRAPRSPTTPSAETSPTIARKASSSAKRSPRGAPPTPGRRGAKPTTPPHQPHTPPHTPTHTHRPPHTPTPKAGAALTQERAQRPHREWRSKHALLSSALCLHPFWIGTPCPAMPFQCACTAWPMHEAWGVAAPALRTAPSKWRTQGVGEVRLQKPLSPPSEEPFGDHLGRQDVSVRRGPLHESCSTKPAWLELL